MITEPTAEQIRHYQDNGFVRIPNFLTPDELEVWRNTLEDAIRQRMSSSGKDMTNQAGPEGDFYANVFLQVLRLADTHEGMRKLIYDVRIGRFAAMLAGIDGIRVWHDQALIKQPYGNPTAWHLDNPYWSFSSRDAISIWIALDDATLENGCLWFVPTSHKTARWDNAGIGVNMGDLFKVYPEWKKIDPVPVPAKAGDALFHNGLTAHGAGANMTNRSRRAMTCAYMPDGSTFNGTRNILPEELFKKLKIGDVIDDEKQTPLIWKKGM
jgi:phytanoyl-CoA hydroxylase